MAPAKGVLYLRVSSQEQAEEGYSLQAQEKEGSSYATRKGIEIVKKWTVSESAKQAGRRAFNEMVEYMKTHSEAKAILFEKPDRMCRNFQDYIKIEELLGQYGKQIHFFKQGTILDKDSKAAEKLNLNLQVVVARHFIDNLSEETKKGLKAKAESGIYPGWAPTGYRNNLTNRDIEIDQERAPKVQKLFRLAVTGNYSVRDLVQIAYELGLRVRGSEKKLYKSNISDMLKNSFYYGYFCYKGVLYKGSHPPLISKQLFDMVQEVLHQRQRPKKTVHNFAFGGFLTCSKCSCAVVGEIQKGRYIYYHCTHGRGNCGSPYVREEKLIEQLSGVVQALEIPKDAFGLLREILLEKRRVGRTDREVEIAELAHRSEQLNQWIDQLYQDRLDRKISDGFWQEKHNTCLAELTTVTEKLDRLKIERDDSFEHKLGALELTQQIYPLYVMKPPHEKKELLKVLLSNCTLDAVTPVPTYRSPFDLIAKAVKNKDWGG